MKFLFGVIGLVLVAHSVSATTLTFGPGTQADFAAATDCIFGGSGVGGCPILVGSSGSAPSDTPTGAPGQSYSGDSWTYTVSELMTALGGSSTFNIVFDSNWAGNPVGDSDYLDFFGVYVNGLLAFDYSPVTPTAMDDGANGTGNENWLLSTVDLSGFLLTDLVHFQLDMSGLTDGFEQVALSAAGPIDPCVLNPMGPGCDPTPMPEPGVLLLLGMGLLGLAIGRRR